MEMLITLILLLFIIYMYWTSIVYPQNIYNATDNYHEWKKIKQWLKHQNYYIKLLESKPIDHSVFHFSSILKINCIVVEHLSRKSLSSNPSTTKKLISYLIPWLRSFNSLCNFLSHLLPQQGKIAFYLPLIRHVLP
jgi:TorA maturation chaperone TorD